MPDPDKVRTTLGAQPGNPFVLTAADRDALLGLLDAHAMRSIVITGAVGPCPDCRGTGQYVGLVETDVCRTCGGDGTRVTTTTDLPRGLDSPTADL